MRVENLIKNGTRREGNEVNGKWGRGRKEGCLGGKLTTPPVKARKGETFLSLDTYRT